MQNYFLHLGKAESITTHKILKNSASAKWKKKGSEWNRKYKLCDNNGKCFHYNG